MAAKKKRAAKPRARVRRDDEQIIDVEAEPVMDERPRPPPPPIVVKVDASKATAAAGDEQGLCAGTAEAFGFRGIARDLKEAEQLGQALGDLLGRVFFGRRK